MTAARADNAARELLARLADEAELETAPLDEVRADLALLDVDPAQSIRFSRRLAEEAASPAGGLLAKSLAAEDSDREIAELESVDLRAIHAELAATNPLAGAYAQRLANAAAGQTRRRSSRRFWYGVGGAITAIAASVVIFIAVSPPARDPQQMAFAPQQELEVTARKQEGPAPVASSLEEQAVIPNQDSVGAPAAPSVALPAPDDEPPVSRSASGGEPGKAVRDPNAEAEAVRAFESFGNSSLALGGAGVAGKSASLPTSRGGVADLTVTAALILQPERAPEALRHANLGKGELMARLSDAAHDRRYQYIVALITVRRPDGVSFDGMLLHSIWSFDRHASTAAGAAPDAAELAAPPPEGPTLGDLLGTEADQFSVILLNAPAPTGQSEMPK
jgi:hypothetical protein